MFQPTAVKYLLLLQTGGEAASPHRRWVQAVCGRLLSGRLTKEGGVLNVMRAVVDAAAGGTTEAEYEARKFEVVAEVIASPPATTYQGGDSVPLRNSTSLAIAVGSLIFMLVKSKIYSIFVRLIDRDSFSSSR